MSMKLKIYIFRHGQTYYNKNHIFTGQKNSGLSQRGIKDAKKIAEKLKSRKFQAAFQTRLSRSKDTLKIVLKYHAECKKIITDDRMIERSYGRLEGKSHKAFIKKSGNDFYATLLHWHKIDHLGGEDKAKFIVEAGKAEFDIVHRSYKVPPPGGESIQEVEQRVLEFIKYLISYMKKNNVSVAISSHGNSMRAFRRYFEKLSIKQMMELENPWDDYFEYTINA